MIKPTRRTHTTTDPHSLPARQVVNSYERAAQVNSFALVVHRVRASLMALPEKNIELISGLLIQLGEELQYPHVGRDSPAWRILCCVRTACRKVSRLTCCDARCRFPASLRRLPDSFGFHFDARPNGPPRGLGTQLAKAQSGCRLLFGEP